MNETRKILRIWAILAAFILFLPSIAIAAEPVPKDIILQGQIWHWVPAKTVQINGQGYYEWYPVYGIDSEILTMDTPFSSESYIEKEFDLPSGTSSLVARIWGAKNMGGNWWCGEPVTTTISLTDSSNNLHELDKFTPIQMDNGIGDTAAPKIYDLTAYAGQKINLRISQTSGNTHCTYGYYKDIKINPKPDIPAALGQFKSDGKIPITLGYTTNEKTVVLKATATDPDNDQLKLQIELRRLDEYGGQFDETQGGLKESSLVPSGSEAAITVNDLIDADYHWRVRAIDLNGNKGEWQEFGGNDISAADFVIYMPAASMPVLQWPLKGTPSISGFEFGDDWEIAGSKCGTLWKTHTGVDLSAKPGDNVYPAYDGIVKEVYNAGPGWAEGIAIEHIAPDNSKFTTTYMHVDHLVKKKDPVTKETKIATIADIKGPHLHFGVRNSGYTMYAQRGSLPKDNLEKGPGKFCKTDAVYPEHFIDPMKLNYEYSNK